MLESAASREKFLRKLEALGARPPWSLSREEPGEILDAEGRAAMVVDHNREIGDIAALELALWVITAVNTCAGFQVVVEHPLVLGPLAGERP